MVVNVSVLCCTEDSLGSRSFERILDDVEIFDARQGEFPSDPDRVIVSGSRSSVLDNDKWIKRLKEKVGLYIRQDVPVLGVCFGHQLVASVLGGNVCSMRGLELGYQQVRLGDCSLFSGLDVFENPFMSHGDEVTELPDCLQAVAWSNRCVHGFEHVEKNVYGIQFHPEFSSGQVKSLVREKNIEGCRKQEVLDRVDTSHSGAVRTRTVFRNFLK